MTEAEFATFAEQMTGRMAMLEALNANMLAYFVINFDKPIPLAAHILAETADTIGRQKTDATEIEQRVRGYAVESFDGLHKAMLALVTRVAEAKGSA